MTDELIAAIYHRFVIFEPVFKEVGTGAVTTKAAATPILPPTSPPTTALGAGLGKWARSTLYPVAGQTAVPHPISSAKPGSSPIRCPTRTKSAIRSACMPSSGRAGGDLTVQSFIVAPRAAARPSTTAPAPAAPTRRIDRGGLGRRHRPASPYCAANRPTMSASAGAGAVHGVAKVSQDLVLHYPLRR